MRTEPTVETVAEKDALIASLKFALHLAKDTDNPAERASLCDKAIELPNDEYCLLQHDVVWIKTIDRLTKEIEKLKEALLANPNKPTEN